MRGDGDDPYQDRMRRVLVHIDDHLDDDLSVDVLARVAAFSKFHFQRQFSALFGISVQRYVRLMRFKRASARLAFMPDESVLAVALDSGFETPEAFARSFRKCLAQSPRAFRGAPQWAPWHAAFAPLEQLRSTHMTPTYCANDVTIVDFPATPVAAKTHHGDPALVGDTIRDFIAWRRAAGRPPKLSATFNIFHVDPDEAAPEDYRLDLCAATDRAIAANDQGVVAGLIPAGRCAMLRVTGARDSLRPAIAYVYGSWLPESGHALRDFPIFVRRVSFYPEVAEHEAVTEVFLPLV